MKLRRTLAFAALTSFAGLALSCSDTTTQQAAQLNLDNPVDVSFACWGILRRLNGADNDVFTTPQPLQSCNIRAEHRGTITDPNTGTSVTEPQHRPPGQDDRTGSLLTGVFYYALILQAEPGTIAVAKFEAKESKLFVASDISVMDADHLTPGKNGVSVGEGPVAIATDRPGCFAVTANAGSCDLSVLDINTVIENAEGSFPDAQDPTATRVDVKDGSGRLVRAKPAAMAFEPPGGTIGEACPAQPTGLAYIAYPSCHMVAGVDVATGTIVTGIQFDAAGTPNLLDPNNVVCNDECGGSIVPSPGPRPVALDLELDSRTGRAVLAIGADNSKALTVYDLDPTTFQPLSLVPQVQFEDPTGKLGITGVAVSPVIGMGGQASILDDDSSFAQQQFVYAVATDGTVRVAEIHGAPRECDANIDPRFLHDVRDIQRLSCFTVGDPTNPKRRTLAKGPGIELPNHAIPTSVDFVTDFVATDEPSPVSEGPARMIGHFAAIAATNGQTFVVNVDDDAQPDFEPSGDGGTVAAPLPLDIAHQLRDAGRDRGALAEVTEGTGPDATRKLVCDQPGPDPDAQQGISGGPRSVGNPVLNIPTNTIAPEKVGGVPSVRQVLCVAQTTNDDGGHDMRPVTELSFSAPLAVRDRQFPDIMGLRADEIWTATWEGPLSVDTAATAVDGPTIRYGQMSIDSSGLRIKDPSRPFCDAGVEPNDIVQLRGCDPAIGDAGCPLGYTCYVHPQSQVPGLGSCMLVNEAERLANACSEYLRSLRRYTVQTTKAGELKLLPRKAELRTTPIDGCTDDAQCEMLADYALKTQSALNPVDDHTGSDPKTWACKADPDRAPKGGTGKRCLLTCDLDADCSAGTVCHADGQAAPRAGYCMEGVLPPQACVNAPQRYDVRAGEAFALLGARQGFIHPIVADAGGNCVRDPNATPFQVGRIPLTAPACEPTADPRTGQLPDGSFEPNPCKTTVDETEYMLNFIPGTCTLNDPDENLVTRPAEAIQLRNRAMNLTIVDPSYPGDAVCIGDRAGSLVNVPLIVPGYQIAFRLTAGFSPLTVPFGSNGPAFPVKIVRGPTDSLWVIDAGDFLSTSLQLPSTRGKVFRVEGNRITGVSTLQ